MNFYAALASGLAQHVHHSPPKRRELDGSAALPGSHHQGITLVPEPCSLEHLAVFEHLVVDITPTTNL